MKPSNALEQQLRETNAQIRKLETEAGEAKVTADARVAELQEAGQNPGLDKELFTEVDELYKLADGPAQEAQEMRQRADSLMQRLGSSNGKANHRESIIRQGAVDRIMESPEYKRLAETGAFASGQGRIELPGTEVVGRDELVQSLRAHSPMFPAMFGATVDGEPMIPIDQRLFPPVPIPVRQIRVLDLITMATTNSDKVDYVEETVRTDAAAETAKGTAYGEAEYDYVRREAVVRDIGHFVPAHRSNLADQGQLQSLLEGRLQTGVQLRLESQIVGGNGIGENLKGILNTSGIAFVDRDVTNTERLVEVIHRGITQVRINLFGEPDAIGIHPSSWEAVLFEKATSTGLYVIGGVEGVAGPTAMTLWGLPVVVSTVFPTGTALVGNYRDGAVAWVRSGVSVRASDSHEDFFTKRMVALLAEMRSAFAAWQPRAFANVDLDYPSEN